MINSRILHSLRDPRERRRHGRRASIGATLRKRRIGHDRGGAHASDRTAQGPSGAPSTSRRDQHRAGVGPAREPSHDGHADPEVERVRCAGGPIDKAAYACECGYLFSAAVSTTVACPHCGAGQAW
jgi:hypothetical protein